jgi:hypothetical protein
MISTVQPDYQSDADLGDHPSPYAENQAYLLFLTRYSRCPGAEDQTEEQADQ